MMLYIAPERPPIIESSDLNKESQKYAANAVEAVVVFSYNNTTRSGYDINLPRLR
jgi:hypothetical protein